MLTELAETPVEEFDGVYVKREDLCAAGFDLPPFSKMRGVVEHIENRPEHLIGVLDTFHSMAGWGVACACRSLGKQAIVFWPRYKNERGLRLFQQHAEAAGAHLAPLKAGMSAVLYHQARKILREQYEDAYMMPNALKLSETVSQTSLELQMTLENYAELDFRTLFISISSGTIAAGIFHGLHATGRKTPKVVLHMGYSRSHENALAYLSQMSEVEDLSPYLEGIVDEGYGYRDKVDYPVPFPCNPYYDAKAWKYLSSHQLDYENSILFWNIGA